MKFDNEILKFLVRYCKENNKYDLMTKNFNKTFKGKKEKEIIETLRKTTYYGEISLLHYLNIAKVWEIDKLICDNYATEIKNELEQLLKSYGYKKINKEKIRVSFSNGAMNAIRVFTGYDVALFNNIWQEIDEKWKSNYANMVENIIKNKHKL